MNLISRKICVDKQYLIFHSQFQILQEVVSILLRCPWLQSFKISKLKVSISCEPIWNHYLFVTFLFGDLHFQPVCKSIAHRWGKNSRIMCLIKIQNFVLCPLFPHVESAAWAEHSQPVTPISPHTSSLSYIPRALLLFLSAVMLRFYFMTLPLNWRVLASMFQHPMGVLKASLEFCYSGD